jgi:hypothetical protein
MEYFEDYLEIDMKKVDLSLIEKIGYILERINDTGIIYRDIEE